MSIIQQLIVILLVVVILYVVIVFQSIALARLLRSKGWALFGSGLLVLGARQIWGFIKLPTAILEAQAKGYMPENLTAEQWILTGALIAALGLVIAGFDKLRRDFRKLGL